MSLKALEILENLIKKGISKAILWVVRVLWNSWQDFAAFFSMIHFVHYLIIIIVQSGQDNK